MGLIRATMIVIAVLLIYEAVEGQDALPFEPQQASSNLLIVFTDGGADDATALIQILEDPDVQLLAILCTYGNVPVGQSCDNVRRTLQLMGKADQVPVYAGSDKPLARPVTFDGYFGYDGLGNNSYKFPLPNETIKSSHAANALNAYADLYPGEITLLQLGPLTDLAIALSLNSSLPSKLKQVYIMGGTSRATGNMSPVAEYNIQVDPEAALAVIRKYDGSITISPLELCEDYCPSWEWYDEWVSSNTSIAFFIQQSFEIVRQQGATNGENFSNNDLLAATAFLYPEVVTQRAAKNADVETCGRLTQGQFVVDNRVGNNSVPNVDMLLAVDQDLLLQRWTDIVSYGIEPEQIEEYPPLSLF